MVPEDYIDEGQGNELVDGVDDTVEYDMEVEIFVSSIELEFTEINCVGLGGQLDYNIVIQNSDGTSIGESSGNVACGGESGSWSESFSSADDDLSLGNYQAIIEFTNGGTPVQANWN